MAAVSGVALIWALTRPMPATGPEKYDVELPDSAMMTTEQGVGFAVAPSGEFVVYQQSGGGGGLWWLSLRTDEVRRIAGTEHGSHPAISPNGKEVAFLRVGVGQAWTLEKVPIEGGGPSILGRGTGSADLSWPKDAQLLVAARHGKELQWVDIVGGRVISTRRGQVCENSSLQPGARLLCGGGGPDWAYLLDGDNPYVFVNLSSDTRANDSLVLGTNFRVIDGRYLVYLSMDGDLAAAPFDSATRHVGRPVRLVSGVARRATVGTGAYGLSTAGTLVYAEGVNHAVGNLVAINEHAADTLLTGRAWFQHFSPNPDRRRIAVVQWVPDSTELRVYNLDTGENDLRAGGFALEESLWNIRGDSLLFGKPDGLYVDSPDQSAGPERVYRAEPRKAVEPYSWVAADRAIVWGFQQNKILTLNLKAAPNARAEVLADSATWPSVSPDGRWMSYSSPDRDELYLQPIPKTGKRYHVTSGDIVSSRWLSSTELTVAVRDSNSTMWIDRIPIDFSGPAPVIPPRRHWLMLPDFVQTPGPSYTLMPDGRVLYLRGAPERPVSYLRVVPDWVSKMKRAVDEANR